MSASRIAVASAATAGFLAIFILRRRRLRCARLFDVGEERVIKRVLFCRHGQGVHNTKDEHGKPQLQIPDPELTAQGVAEARAIFGDHFPGRVDFKPDVVIVSPLWRTLQTATEAMAARSDGHTCPMIADDVMREHNNINQCNHRRKIQKAHLSSFPAVDFSGVDTVGPPPGAEWAVPYKAAFGRLRSRCEQALKLVDDRPEECIAVFCHATFIRALLSNVLELGPHHAVKAPNTGEAVEVWRIETPNGDRYWELKDNQKDGREVLRLGWRDESGLSVSGERDDGAVAK